MTENHTLTRLTTVDDSNSTEPEAHQNRIFFRVSIVA